MKMITSDTLMALMSENPKQALLKCGFTENDIKDCDSMWESLHDVPKLENQSNPFQPIVDELVNINQRLTTIESKLKNIGIIFNI